VNLHGNKLSGAESTTKAKALPLAKRGAQERLELANKRLRASALPMRDVEDERTDGASEEMLEHPLHVKTSIRTSVRNKKSVTESTKIVFSPEIIEQASGGENDDAESFVSSNASSNASTNGSPTYLARKNPTLKSLPSAVSWELEMVLWIPQFPTPMTIDILPLLVESQLRKLYGMYTSSNSREKAYGSLLRNYRNYLDGKRCVNNKVINRSRYEMTFELAAENKMRACDQCTRAGRLCARLIEEEGTIKMALYPLATKFRQMVSWKELGFWVRQ
jgi:hypothetical protein